jgi:antitoxin component YwqK of YwqJK toxin-antitoxin module
MKLPYSIIYVGVGLCAGFGCASQKKSTQAAAPVAEVEEKRPVKGGESGPTGDVRTSDIDNDGKSEVYKYYNSVDDPDRPGEKKTVLVRQDIDLTWDGKIDIWRYFDAKGKVEREEWDTDFDGNVDETRYFEGGVLARAERDRNNDGKPDMFRYYKLGKLERKESDTNGDGQIDRWEYFTGKVLDRVGVDKNYDGSVDTWAKAEGAPAK